LKKREIFGGHHRVRTCDPCRVKTPTSFYSHANSTTYKDSELL
jgi:hypothetical protein